jgi:flagellar hook protein FlgE
MDGELARILPIEQAPEGQQLHASEQLYLNIKRMGVPSMGLYGVMRTSVSGMEAQSNKLSTVADNISNVNTTGYKDAEAEFSSLVLSSGSGSYESGSVQTTIRYSITESGAISSTTSATDLAISGNGYFIVTDDNNTPYLTRAGSFLADDDGNLVNTAGYYLMGYDISDGSTPSTGSGYGGLEVINVSQNSLQADPSTTATASANLNVDATISTGGTDYTSKTSIVTYDNVGSEVTLDVYMFKTADNTWDIQVYNNADSTNDTFPYSSAALATDTFTFDVSSTGLGKLATASPTSLSLTIPGGSAFTLDLSSMTQVASDFSFTATVDGNAPSAVDSVEIDTDGILYMVYENGTREAAYQIPLATCASPDNMTVETGNVYSISMDSGNVQISLAGTGGLGTIKSESLEASNADLGTELTNMIEAQRGFTANSKVFQTGSDLLDVLVNLKR